MAVTLTLTVEEPDAILNAGAYGTGALMRLQWCATETGAFADVSGTGSTPTIAVVTLTRSYAAFDPDGTVSRWYRTRFENAAGTRLSDWSDPFQPAPEGTGLICSLWDVKQALGITGTTQDEDILEHIRRATSEIMRYTGRRFVRSPASGTTTYLFDVGGSARVLRIPAGIAEASTLEVATSTQPETGGTYTTVPAAEWWLRPVVAERDYGWPATRICISDVSGSLFWPGYNTVRVTMALGWETVPYDIAGIGERAAVSGYMSKGSGGANAVVGPSGAMTLLRNISPADRATLDEYRVIP
jgi:hypothetical protein